MRDGFRIRYSFSHGYGIRQGEVPALPTHRSSPMRHRSLALEARRRSRRSISAASPFHTMTSSRSPPIGSGANRWIRSSGPHLSLFQILLPGLPPDRVPLSLSINLYLSYFLEVLCGFEIWQCEVAHCKNHMFWGINSPTWGVVFCIRLFMYAVVLALFICVLSCITGVPNCVLRDFFFCYCCSRDHC